MEPTEATTSGTAPLADTRPHRETDELPPSAERPQEHAGPGRSAAGLSDAELRVATLAARGDTNRQIAGKLFITISTVEQHLTRVYRKLEVRNRTDLAPRLRSGGTGASGSTERRGNGTASDRLRAV
jgi:DNA-binding CsgD family transcriptional regulator